MNPRLGHSEGFVVAVAALIFREGKVLAMRRSARKDAGAGLWETVSGRLEAGEQPLDAVKREIREETNLDVELLIRPVTAYTAMRADKEMVVVVYCAVSFEGEVVRSAEHDDHRWCTPNEFAQLSQLPLLVDAVHRAAAMVGCGE